MSLQEKLFEIQKKHLRIGKNATAGKDGKWGYKYATLDKVWDEIQDLMDELKLVEFTRLTHVDGESYVSSSISDLDTGDLLESHFPIDKGLSPQDLGKAITYGRRYNLVALLNLKIVGEDDDAQGVGSRNKGVNGDKFVDTIIKNGNVEKAQTLMDKVSSGDYILSEAKKAALVGFIDSNA